MKVIKNFFIKIYNLKYVKPIIDGIRLFFRRLIINYKNHFDGIPFIIYTISVVILTFAIYDYTNTGLTHLRRPILPLAMIQFFAVLCSMLGFVALMNYRSQKKKLYGVIFYSFASFQVLYDAYYIFELFNHINNEELGVSFDKVSSVFVFSVVHLSVLLVAIILLALTPIIQKHTKMIKLKPISNQDRDLR